MSNLRKDVSNLTELPEDDFGFPRRFNLILNLQNWGIWRKEKFYSEEIAALSHHTKSTCKCRRCWFQKDKLTTILIRCTQADYLDGLKNVITLASTKKNCWMLFGNSINNYYKVINGNWCKYCKLKYSFHITSFYPVFVH